MKKFILYTIFSIQLIIILAFWYQGAAGQFRDASSIFQALGRLSGLLLVCLILLQLLMRARIPFVEDSIGFERLNMLHKKNGYIVFGFLFAHPIFLTIGYALDAKVSLLSQFIDFLINYDDVLKAFLAVLMFIGVIATSIYIVRKKLRHELWYFIHLITYIAVIFAWGHQLGLGSDFSSKWFVYYWYFLYAGTAISILYWRFFKLILINYNHRFYISEIKKETHDTYSLYIKGKNLQKFYFEPGQFVMIRFLTKNLWWESHPFSFSEEFNEKYLRLTIKNSGDFTATINTIKKNTPVALDGPHGEFVLSSAKTKKLLYIAGGVGITPIRSMMRIALEKKNNVILLYSNKTSEDIIFKKELDELSKKHLFSIHHIVSRDRHFKGLQGRIDVILIKKLVPDFQKRDIFICGPSKMPLTLQKYLLEAQVPKDHIHFEQFVL